MNDLTHLTPDQLRRAADIQEQIQSLREQLTAILEGSAQTPVVLASAGRKRRNLSPEGLANIRAGVAKRMAKKASATLQKTEKPKRRISAALRKARSEAMKARWAARKASGKKSL